MDVSAGHGIAFTNASVASACFESSTPISTFMAPPVEVGWPLHRAASVQ